MQRPKRGISRAGCALRTIIKEREAGNSTDPVLRDSEYWLRNYIGGRLPNSRLTGEEIPIGYEDAFTEIVLQSPPAVAGYNILKTITNFAGQGDINPIQPENPNAAPGGLEAAIDAFHDGTNGTALDRAIGNAINDGTRRTRPSSPSSFSTMAIRPATSSTPRSWPARRTASIPASACGTITR